MHCLKLTICRNYMKTHGKTEMYSACYASYNVSKAKEVWQKIRDLAIKKGYKLGIRFKYKKSNNLTSANTN